MLYQMLDVLYFLLPLLSVVVVFITLFAWTNARRRGARLLNEKNRSQEQTEKLQELLDQTKDSRDQVIWHKLSLEKDLAELRAEASLFGTLSHGVYVPYPCDIVGPSGAALLEKIVAATDDSIRDTSRRNGFKVKDIIQPKRDAEGKGFGYVWTEEAEVLLWDGATFLLYFPTMKEEVVVRGIRRNSDYCRGKIGGYRTHIEQGGGCLPQSVRDALVAKATESEVRS